MRYTGIQPQYFPRLHYFSRILNADVFVSRDDCQFLKKHKYPDGKTGKSYQAHSPIKVPSGEFFLSFPVVHDGFKPIYKTEISYEEPWNEDQLKTIQINYSKAPKFKEIFNGLEVILNSKPNTVGQLNMLTILWGISQILGKKNVSVKELNIDTINDLLKNQKKFRLKKILKATDMKVTQDRENFDNLSPNEKITALISETGADEDYCGGTSLAAYIDHALFEKNGIKITVQDWKCGKYSQLFEKQSGFVPNLSIIDIIMNISSEDTVKIMRE